LGHHLAPVDDGHAVADRLDVREKDDSLAMPAEQQRFAMPVASARQKL
jgi:hypothetical protein